MDFFLSSEVTLGTKLLEIIYIAMGLTSIYTGIKNLRDKTNKNNIGTFIFWFCLGIVLSFGRWIPSKVNGIIIIIMIMPAVLKKVSVGQIEKIPQEKLNERAAKLGLKLFLPALSIGIFAVIFAIFTKLGALVGIGFGILVAMVLLMLFSRENTPKTFFDDSANILSTLGPLSILPLLLASLGAIFTKAGVGDVISGIVGSIIPEGNVTVGIIVFALGMMLFTAIMGNAFAAITVMLVGIANPFILKYGANPVLIASVGLTAGYCGTLLTPMAANFNIVPVALLDMKNRMGVIKNQILPAIIMLIVQIIYMILFY